MILLDTNVVSEPMRPNPDRRVQAWLDAQPIETLFLSAMTVAELRAGVAWLPAGKRRSGLLRKLEAAMALFAGRVLAFDLACTAFYADALARARASGLAISTADACIAAVAAAHRMTVATRDGRPFRAVGSDVIDPWSA